MATVYSVYAESMALKVRKTPIDDIPVDKKPIVRSAVRHRTIDIHKEYVSLWLKRERSVRESLRIKESEDMWRVRKIGMIVNFLLR